MPPAPRARPKDPIMTSESPVPGPILGLEASRKILLRWLLGETAISDDGARDNGAEMVIVVGHVSGAFTNVG